MDGEVIAATGPGLLVFVAVKAGDTEADAERLAERIINFRVFADDSGRMNHSLLDLGLDLLLVSQFTLAANTRKGRRASFTGAATPEAGRALFDLVLRLCRERLPRVASGRFGAMMRVALVNDGPVTFWLES